MQCSLSFHVLLTKLKDKLDNYLFSSFRNRLSGCGVFLAKLYGKKKEKKKEGLIAVYNEVFNECVLSQGVKLNFCCQFTNMFISNLLIF